MEGAKKLMGIRKEDAKVYSDTAARRGRKRSRSPENDHVEGTGQQPKIPKRDSEPAMSGALPTEEAPTEAASAENNVTEVDVEAVVPTEEKSVASVEQAEAAEGTPAITQNFTVEPTNATPSSATSAPTPQPPAARLRMTVTSGFYVRSLCHDLGLACSSLGLMSSLVRSRQGDYTLGQNVLEYTDLEDPSKWEPQLQKQLEDFMEKEGWEIEELDDDESWEERKKDLMEQRKDGDREKSYRGGGKGKWNSKGKGKYGRSGYSKNMDGGRK
jgi:tRNA pseudouridine55 synthase